VGAASDAGQQGARVAAYRASLEGGDRKMRDLGSSIALLDNSSKLSMSALPAELQQFAVRRNNARDMGNTRISASAAKRDGEVDINGRYTSGMGDALDRYAGTVSGAEGDYTTRSRGANADYASALIDSSSNFEGGSVGAAEQLRTGLQGTSQNFENAMQGITNYKVANTRAYSPLGTILSTAGGLAMQAGANGAGPSWGSIFKGAAKTPTTILPKSMLGIRPGGSIGYGI
jgi:hypothetical protein